MLKHLKYLSYVVRHKWFVLQAGLMLKRECEARLPLRQLILHDWTKFLPREWGPYVEAFYGKTPTERRNDGGYDATAVSNRFDYAWLSHQRNKHHWQAWVLAKDDGGVKPLQMPWNYVWEMLADWMGAGMAINGHGLDKAFTETAMWYNTNRDNMQLHPATRRFIESFLGLDPYRVPTGDYIYGNSFLDKLRSEQENIF